MGIETLLKGFSEKIEAVKTKLQGEVIWTHAHNSACIHVLVVSRAHSLSDIESFHRSTQTEELTKFKVAVLKHFVQGNVVW